MVGEKLSHFRILEKIGEGGMGVVYRAEDERLRRPVALKTLHPELMDDARQHRRLLREARAAAAVAHPNIAAIYEIDEVDGTTFIAMELIDGETLRSRLGSETAVLRIATQISEALAEAHRIPLLHRDLKPENVFLARSGHVKILDFGLAKPLPAEEDDTPGSDTETADLTGEGTLVGTARYMSPEQLRGQTLDGRSDLFSLGIVLYETLTGQHPFRRASAIDMLGAILREDPKPIAELRPEAPTELADIIHQLLIKERRQRFPSAHHLAVALRALRHGRTDAGRQSFGALAGKQAKLCICGRSQDLPFCDGSHDSEDWSCASGTEKVRFAFCATDRYRNLARKLAAHYQGVTCLAGEPYPDAEVLIFLLDGTDLEWPLAVQANTSTDRRVVVSLGVKVDLLRRLFPGSEPVDLSQEQPLYAFKRISALIDAGDFQAAEEDTVPPTELRSAFISHAVADEPWILPVKDFLQSYYRVDVFTCADSIRPGNRWQAEILDALRQKEVFVFVLSEASLASHFCSFEIGCACALDKPISIISLDGSLPPVFVQHLQTVDLKRIRRTKSWLEIHDLLLEALLEILM